MDGDIQWDFLFHTSDRNFSGMGLVYAQTEDQARELVKEQVQQARPDVTIKEIRIEPSVLPDQRVK